jgi:hypothetical protein
MTDHTFCGEELEANAEGATCILPLGHSGDRHAIAVRCDQRPEGEKTLCLLNLGHGGRHTQHYSEAVRLAIGKRYGRLSAEQAIKNRLRILGWMEDDIRTIIETGEARNLTLERFRAFWGI